MLAFVYTAAHKPAHVASVHLITLMQACKYAHLEKKMKTDEIKLKFCGNVVLFRCFRAWIYFSITSPELSALLCLDLKYKQRRAALTRRGEDY